MAHSWKVRCDGISRRDFVRIGGWTASAAGLGLVAGRVPAKETARQETARRCILIWLDGGPSHLETFDLKPGAPAEVRGPFQPISTRVPGIAVCELMPELAKRTDLFSVVRSVTSPLGEHNFGAHYLMTGYKPSAALEYPAIGSVVAELNGPAGRLPGHVAVPSFRVGGGRLSGGGFLPEAAHPFSVGGDPSKPTFRVRDLEYYPGVNRERIERRKRYLDSLNQLGGTAGESSGFEQAYDLLSSADAKRAFDLSEESPKTRRRYGPRTIGQSCLLARRLVERGVPFVTVNNPGWDTHANAYTRLKEGYTGAKVPVGLIPSLDLALSALLDDLRRSGLLDETLVLVMGEFGRTPKLNTQGGRDHWPRVFSVVLAGAGVPGGQVIGQSDAVGESPQERPVSPADLATTVYQILGIDPQHSLRTPDGRPIQVGHGLLIEELLG